LRAHRACLCLTHVEINKSIGAALINQTPHGLELRISLSRRSISSPR
jgi:hypothetical protein